MSLRLIVIAGPTACGKTRLGVRLAHRLGSEILSADSRQVYQGLDIGTGKDLEEYREVDPPVSVHLIDLVPPERVFSLYDYQQACYRILRRKNREARYSEGNVPLVMVGGTGLYIEAVLRQYRLANVPEDPELRRRLMQEDHAELCRRLEREDPGLFARTDIKSKKRVVRALEIAAFAAEAPVRYTEPLGIELDYQIYCLDPDRGDLYRAIGARLERRLGQGMVEEVRRLVDSGLPRSRLDQLGMEYRQIAAYLEGDKDYETMVADLAQEIRHLAKRQLTWFRGMTRRGLPVTWIEPGEAEAFLDRMAPPALR